MEVFDVTLSKINRSGTKQDCSLRNQSPFFIVDFITAERETGQCPAPPALCTPHSPYTNVLILAVTCSLILAVEDKKGNNRSQVTPPMAQSITVQHTVGISECSFA